MNKKKIILGKAIFFADKAENNARAKAAHKMILA